MIPPGHTFRGTLTHAGGKTMYPHGEFQTVTTARSTPFSAHKLIAVDRRRDLALEGKSPEKRGWWMRP